MFLMNFISDTREVKCQILHFYCLQFKLNMDSSQLSHKSAQSKDPFNYVLYNGSPDSSFITQLPGNNADLMSNLEVALLFQGAEIERLHKTVQQGRVLHKGQDRLDLDRHSYQVQIKQLTNVIESVQKQKAGLKRYIDQINSALESRMKSSKGSSGSQNQSSETIKKLQNKYEKALLEIQKLYNDNTKLQQQLNQANRQLYQSKLVQGKNGNYAYEKGIRQIELENRILSLQQQLNIAEQKEGRYEEQVNQVAKYRYEQYEQKIRILENANKQYQQIVRKYDLQIENMRIQIQKQVYQNRQLEQSKRQLAMKSSNLIQKNEQELQNKVAMISQQLERLTLVCQQKAQKITQLISENERIQQIHSLELDNFKKQVDIKQSHINRLQHQLQHQQGDLSNRSAAQNIATTYRNHIDELQNKLKQLVYQLNQKSNEIASNNRQHLVKIQYYRQKLQLAQDQAKKLQKQYHQQKTILQEMKHLNKQTTQLFSRIHSKVEELQEEITNSHKSLEVQISHNSVMKIKTILDCVSEQIVGLTKIILRNSDLIAESQAQVISVIEAKFETKKFQSNRENQQQTNRKDAEQNKKTLEEVLERLLKLDRERDLNTLDEKIQQIRRILTKRLVDKESQLQEKRLDTLIKSDEINKLQHQIKQYESIVKQLQTKNKDSVQIQSLKLQLTKKNIIINRLQAQISQAPSNTTRDLVQQLARKQQEMRIMLEEIEKQRKRYLDIKSKLRNVEDKLEEFIELSNKDQEHVKGLERKNRILQEKYHTAKQKADYLNHERIIFITEISSKFDHLMGLFDQHYPIQAYSQNEIFRPLNLEQKFKKLVQKLSTVKSQNVELNKLIYSENTNEYVRRQFGKFKLSQLNAELDRLYNENINLKEQLLANRLQLSSEVSIQKQKQENLGLVMLLMCEVEALRSRIN